MGFCVFELIGVSICFSYRNIFKTDDIGKISSARDRIQRTQYIELETAGSIIQIISK